MSTNSSTRSSTRNAKIEHTGLEMVRPEERRGKPRTLFGIWSSTNLTLGSFVTGALGIQLGLSLWQAAIGMVIGIVLGAVLIPTMSYVGFRLGIPQMLMARAVFGRVGAALPAAIAWCSFLGWFTVLDVLGAQALESALGLPMIPGLIILSAITIGIGMVGYDLVHAIEKWLALVVGIVFVILAVIALGDIDWSYAGDPAVTGGARWGLFGLVVAISFSYAGPGYTPYASDYTRYLPLSTRFREIFTPSFVGMVLSASFVFLLGAAITTIDTTAQTAGLIGEVAGAMKIPVMLALAAGTVGANVLNVYSGSLTALVVGLRLPQWASAVTIGLLGTIFATWFQMDFVANYEKWLLAILYVLPAMDALFLVDFFVVRRRKYNAVDFTAESSNPAFHWRAWIAYLIGVASCIPFMSSFLHTGSVATALNGADISYLVSMIVAALVYLALSRVGKTSTHSATREHEPTPSPAAVTPELA
ncbi:cytosine permease [Rhodococcus sp. UFZ-B548]|uniref:purine-cytosine permease family protein n=1 Tax=Rhodococcus sp. UFZ-B548 TaxID=2742212 RepID=UPI0015F6D868|nr:cytosine permease [Rhodococcus sp. UFZ-B548]